MVWVSPTLVPLFTLRNVFLGKYVRDPLLVCNGIGIVVELRVLVPQRDANFIHDLFEPGSALISSLAFEGEFKFTGSPIR